MNILIKNGNVLKSDCSGFVKKDLYIKDGKISDNCNVDKVIDYETNEYNEPGSWHGNCGRRIFL